MMRLIIGLVLAVGAVTGTAVRAESGQAGLSIEGGMNFGNVTTPADIQSATRTGYMVGLGLEVPITSFLSLRPEVIYAQRGSYLTKGNTVEVTVNSHAVEVPVLLKMGFGEKIRPFLFLGPTFIANLSSDLKAATEDMKKAVNFDQNSFDVAGTLGLGVELGSLFVAGRYNVGIVSVNANSAQWKSRGVQALVGINI